MKFHFDLKSFTQVNLNRVDTKIRLNIPKRIEQQTDCSEEISLHEMSH